MKNTKLHIVLSIYGDQIAVLFADKWSAMRRRNAMVKSGKFTSNEIWVGEVQLGSDAKRVARTVSTTPRRRKST